MEGKKRMVLVVLIAAVIVVAVFASFGLTFFMPDTPEIRLPSVTDSGKEERPVDPDQREFVRVAVTPETVQEVIRTLVPLQPESYSRTITVEVDMGEGASSAYTNRVWVDGGWTRVEAVWPNGTLEHTLVGDGLVYRWYGGDSSWTVWEAGDRDANLAQRIPTYEDVLALEEGAIIAAGYEEKNGIACVYVETAENEAGCREKYWVSVDHGLLVAAESKAGETVLLSMGSDLVEIPVAQGTAFTLPDGSVLHELRGTA